MAGVCVGKYSSEDNANIPDKKHVDENLSRKAKL